MNRNDLIAALAAEFPDRAQCGRAVRMVFDVMKDSLRRGEKVSITGFGAFRPSAIGRRSIKSPSGRVITAEPRKRVLFRASPDLLK